MYKVQFTMYKGLAALGRRKVTTSNKAALLLKQSQTMSNNTNKQYKLIK